MVTRMENFGAVDEEPTTSLEMEVEETVTVEVMTNLNEAGTLYGNIIYNKAFEYIW